MSDRLFALLLRMYPQEFRMRFGEEAMQLYRDRATTEHGAWRRVRLWWDLLLDEAIAVPRLRSYARPVYAGPAVRATEGAPIFRLLQPEVPSVQSIFYGGIASLVVFSSMFVWMGHGRNQRLLQALRDTPESATLARGLPLKSPQPYGTQQSRGASAEEESGSSGIRASDAGLNGKRPPHEAAAVAPGTLEADAAQPHVEDATAAMIAAIDAHQIVMFGETHGNKQEYEWLCALVKTPKFADRVDDVVVEFGNSLYQKTVDRYVAGEDLPREQVQKAWRNVIGAVGPVSPVYGQFYDAVRAANLERRGKHPIRLLLGDPYGDWDKIKDAEGLGPYLSHRDQWYAQVVKDEVLAKHHRALLIMGAGHFLRRNGPGLVEQEILGAGVNPYLIVLGTNAVGGYDDLDPRFDAWRVPAIVPLAGNWVGNLPAMPVVTGGEVAANALKMADVADALLYVGSRDTLTSVNVPRSELDGTAYGAEINRRLTIQMGRTMEFTAPPEVPQYPRPVQQTVSTGIHRLPPAPPKSVNDPLPPRPPSQ
jgi:hypothetical protein